MSIPVACPKCGAEYALADRMAGKKVRCKKCEAVIAVAPESNADAAPAKRPAAEAVRATAPRPSGRANRRGRDEDEEDAPPIKKSGGAPLALILGGVGLAALLLLAICAGVVGYFVLARSAPTTAPVVSTNPKPTPPTPPANNPGPQPNPRPPDPPARPPFQPDPLPAAPADNLRGDIPIAGVVNQVVFPTSPSPFVSIAAKAGLKETREVWDLRTGQRVGAISSDSLLNDAVLSPDGVYLAARGPFGGKSTVVVWTVADGSDNKITIDDKAGSLPDIDFAGPGQLLTAKSDGLQETFQIWDVKTGAEVHRFTAPSPSDRKQRAFSAGRRYLAVCGRVNSNVAVFDLTTGKQAADLPAPPNGVCQGLTFSPDGLSLAGLFGLGATARLQAWDLTRGQPTFGHDFDKNPQNTAQNGFGYQGLPLEWLPDGGGWLLYGQMLVEGTKGSVFWRIPNDGADANPRRLFPGGQLASVKGDLLHKSLVVETLPMDQVAAARKTAETGQDPGAAALPSAKAADWSAVKELPAPAGAVDWKAGADAAAAPKAGLGARPITLGGKAGDLVRILFSAPDVAQAVVLSASSAGALGDRKQVHVDRYDLASGQALGGFDLFVAEFPRDRQTAIDADLSPDGALLAVREPKAGKRIDVWSLAEGKQVVGWQPCEKEGDGLVRWFAFLDAKRLLTQGAKLTLWDVPECRAVYSAGFVRATPALSPGRKVLAAFTGTSFEFLEAATGERVGQLVRPDAQILQAAAFRPDGRELAAVVGTGEGSRLIHWDATTGTAKGDCAVTSNMGALEWCGADDVLFDQTLIDFNLKGAIALYNLPGSGRHATGSPDGRHWFAYGRTPNDPPVLTAAALPDDAVQQLKKQIAAGQVQVLLGPGMTVNVRVDGAGPDVNADVFRKNLIDGLTQRLRSEGFKTGPDGTVTLAVQIQPARDTGKTEKYNSIGPGGKQVIDIHIQEAAVEATLTDGRGVVLWSQKASGRTPLPQNLFDVKDLQATLNKGLWDGVASWVNLSGAPPSGLIRTPAGVEPLPRPLILK